MVALSVCVCVFFPPHRSYTDFAQAFENAITTFQMLWNDIGLLVSQVLPSHSTKSHDFF